MSTIDELRGLVERAKQYLEQTGPDHDWGCPGDDTCDCETGQNQKAVDKLVQITPALLAVAEAARGVELSAGMPAPHVEIKDTDTFEIQLTGKEVAGLLNALARLDGEVGHG